MPLNAPAAAALTGGFDRITRLIEQAMHIPQSEDAIRRDLLVDGRRAALFYVDGMIDNLRVADYVLRPCMQAQGIECTPAYFMQSVLPIGSASPTMQLSTLLNRVYSGDAALVVDGMEGAVLCDIKGYAKRSVSKPSGEMVVPSRLRVRPSR